MPLPRTVARFNKRYTNRFLEPLVRRGSGFAIVHHTGRRSGSEYTTPVNVFWSEGHAIVALTYGPSADWVRNVVAGNGLIELDGEARPITAVELVDRSVAWPSLPVFVRFALTLLQVRHFLRLSAPGRNPSQ